ncbi:hypothetical protein NL676_008279 [Syzygium grande]|nr:hypothetical protein NL676_008279 [Syzygium grande]
MMSIKGQSKLDITRKAKRPTASQRLEGVKAMADTESIVYADHIGIVSRVTLIVIDLLADEFAALDVKLMRYAL